MKKVFHLLILPMAFIGFNAEAQPQDSSAKFLRRIFLPSFDVGYQLNASDLIGNSVKTATSIEYRIRNNNDFFLRLNYDTYGARYKLSNPVNTINTVEGSVQATDLLLGTGYRLGDNTFRLMFSIQPGIKFYEFPLLNLEERDIKVALEGRSVFTTTFLATLEYYFDEKSALTISLFENQVWQKVDFWEDSGVAFGGSIGFITSLL